MMFEKLEIICIESEAFYRLLENVMQHFKKNQKQQQSDKWISDAEAMRILRIKSKTTLQKLRDEGQIRFTQPKKKLILYDTDSIREYLEDFVYEPFDAPVNKNSKV